MVKSKYINPFTDYGFKKLFGEEGSKKLLISFLNDLLPIKDKIVKINFKKNEQLGDSEASRKAIYDIFCDDEKGNQFIVEMQNSKQVYFRDRAVYYSTFPIRDQAPKGEWDFKLKDVYCVGLLGFEFEKETKEYLNTVQLKNQDNKVFYNKLTFMFIELPKFNKKESELETHFEKWMYLLKNLDSFDTIPEILKEDIFEEAFEVAAVAKLSEEDLKAYEYSLKVFRDNINIITTAMQEARAEGLAEGKAEILIKQLLKKFKILPDSYKGQILKLPQETVEIIAMDIFDLSTVEELEKYL